MQDYCTKSSTFSVLTPYVCILALGTYSDGAGVLHLIYLLRDRPQLTTLHSVKALFSSIGMLLHTSLVMRFHQLIYASRIYVKRILLFSKRKILSV